MTFRVAAVPLTGAHAAVNLAVRELIDHLGAACDDVRFGRTRHIDRAHFVLGTFDDLGTGVLGEAMSNDRWIDRVIVRSDDGRVLLAGSNSRSVLFAVYTYLDVLGFAWLTPGEEGQVTPKLADVPLDGFALDHTASLIYRGFGVAGAFDGERGERYVQWMTRNRFNHVFLEGALRRKSFEMELDRNVPPAEARRHDWRIVRAAKQRGLLHEKMGHGWTARVLGIDHEAIKAGKTTPADEQLAMAGLRNGRRSIEDGNTQLCLSNPRANERMIEEVVAYAREHTELDVLGVWMADGFNNWCECEQCQQVHPSDLWVRLINRIAEAAHAARPDLRIEVLGYSVLMEPPPTERIDNRHGNIILMYAPFLRCYVHTLDDPACVSDQPLRTFPPANRLLHPMNYEYFTFLNGWLKVFEGTNYIFDYYCWLPIKRDFFEGNVPETMCRDLNRYPAMGLMGLVDCSRVQSFWPTPMARWMQARASWDANVDYVTERTRLLRLAYGEHADVVARYLSLAYECLLPDPHGREEERGFEPAKVERFKQSLPSLRDELAVAIEASHHPLRRMLERVDVHAVFTALHLDQLLAEAAGEFDRAMELAAQMHALAKAHRALLDGVADPPEFAWLENDTRKRLERKKAGTWVRID